ncbi:MAG: hypothetical protein HKN91_06840 [Acidimicrobiia bacterium]|nr:hypothetical protein [Acidimicrobiia bacterium]
MKFFQIVAASALTVAMLWPSAAWACSRIGPVPLEDVLDSGEIYSSRALGVHEQRHIARIPGVPFLINERSASVVLRYWGDQPNLSVASHGDEGVFLITTTSCGSPAKPVGQTTMHVNTESSLERPRFAYSNVNTAGVALAAGEVVGLEAHFGPTIEVSLGPDDYVVAYALLLWRPAVVFGTLGTLAFGFVSKRRRASLGDRRLDGPTLAAALLGVTGVAIVTPSYGVFDWLGLLLALAASVGVGWIVRIPWAAFGIAYAAYFAIRPDPLFLELDSGDRRLHTAIGALIVGAGVLVWSRHHWVRFAATFTVLSGTFFFVLGTVEVRGYRNMTKAVALASIATGTAGLAVWWVVFRERTLSSGALAEPPDGTAEADRRLPSR